ncbi:MAG: methyltransferase domain-containing protein, partial [Pseudomonadota bacterium]
MDSKAYGEMAAVEDQHWWFCGRRAVSQEVIATLGKRDARILEVGSGTGGNLPMLSQFGDVTAVEMEEAAREITRQKYGFDAKPGHLPNDMPPLQGPFDLICMFDVLEHVNEDE